MVRISQRSQGIPGARLGISWLWLLAALAAALVLLPVGYLVLRALGSERGLWNVLLQPGALSTLLRTAWLAVSVTAAAIALALPLAWLTTCTNLPGRRVWAVLTALPLVIPSFVGAYLLVASLGPRGMIAQWLGALGWLPQLPPIYGYPGAFYLLTLLSYPYVLLSLRAALQGIDPAMEEAARSLGYGPWQTFWRVTLPQLSPAMASGGLFVALYVLRDFGAVSILRYNTFTQAIYIHYSSSFDRAAASILALALVAVSLGVLALDLWRRGRARYYVSSAAASRPPRRVDLGRWRWPALLFCAGVALLALLIPAAVLVYWLLRGWHTGIQLVPLWDATRNSLLASLLAAGATTAMALPVAILNVRRPGWWSNLFERLTYAGFALPGIVVALALVFLGIHYARPFYQSLPMLVLAYVILFLPQAVGSLRASLLQIHPSLEEAARGLGRSPLRVISNVTLPLARPGILSALALVLLTAMKELPATLILSPLGFRTLSTAVWSAVGEAFFARAAAPALMLVAAASLPMAFLVLRERQ